MSNITNTDAVVTESKLKDFYEDIKPFLGCPAYLTSEGNAEYYSTDEKVIGRWTDDKPLYEKIVTFSYPTTSKSWKNEAVLDTTCSIVLFNAYIYGVSNGLVPVPNPYNQTLFIVNASYVSGSGWSNKNGNFAMLTEATEYLGANGIALVKYTKTTDSATTTIQEDPNEYSTDEKIIGKWIDGKPLYQKTFKYSSGGGDTSWPTQGVYLTTSNNIKDIISCDTTFMWENNWQSAPYYEVENDMDKVFVIVDGTTHNLALFHKIKTVANVDVYATIKYTKTTDV